MIIHILNKVVYKTLMPPISKHITIDFTFDLYTDLTINRDHLLKKDYLPTKFQNIRIEVLTYMSSLPL